MRKPFFSVIIPTFNRKKLLEEAVKSVLSQTYGNFELIVVDDCSSDDTSEYLNRIKDKRVHIYRNETNRHVSYSRNRGLEYARGDWIVFLDDDDTMLPEKLQVLFDAIVANPDITFIHHKVWMHYIHDNKKRLSSNYFSSNYKEEIFVSNMIGGPNNVCIKKDLLVQEKGFDTSLRLAEEYELWIRLSMLKAFAPLFLENPLAIIQMERGGGSLDQDIDAFREAHIFISKQYREEIESLPEQKKKERKKNFYYRFATRCIYGNKRLCSSANFWKAFLYSKDFKYFFAMIISVISPTLLVRLYR